MKSLAISIFIVFLISLSSILKADWPGVYVGYHDSTNNEAYAIAVDNSGNVYVTGMGDHDYNGSGTNIATVMYSPSGVQQWVAHHDGNGGDDEDAGTSIVTYYNGENTFIYVTGRTYGQSGITPKKWTN